MFVCPFFKLFVILLKYPPPIYGRISCSFSNKIHFLDFYSSMGSDICIKKRKRGTKKFSILVHEINLNKKITHISFILLMTFLGYFSLDEEIRLAFE